MNRSTLNHANQRATEDLEESFRYMYAVTSWRTQLVAYAERGYPTGGDSHGPANSISRPTESIALSPLDEPAAKLKRADELARIIRDAARELNSIRIYTTTPAAYKEPEPVPCRNLNCPNIMERHKGESPRDGRCPRCATHYRRYHLEYPLKHIAPTKP